MTNMGFDIIGVDLNPDIFSKTIDRFHLKVFKSDIEREKLPFPDNTFDFVIFTEVFEHLRIDPIFTASELHRVLQKDGILLLSTPNLYSLSGIYNFIFKGRSYACCTADIYDEFKLIETFGFFGHIREYSFQEVSSFLKKIGFKDIKIIFRSRRQTMGTKLIYYFAPFLQSNMLFLTWKGDIKPRT